jgi:hypothetical protein
MFDAAHKKKMRDAYFPLDCDRAFQLGERLASWQGGEEAIPAAL